MEDDEVMKEVLHIRDEIAARFNYDVAAIGAHYLELQEKNGIKTVSLPPEDQYVCRRMKSQRILRKWRLCRSDVRKVSDFPAEDCQCFGLCPPRPLAQRRLGHSPS
jgi:hypothetical protein